MSLAATRWAWKARAGGAKRVLLALADHADDAGFSFPSNQRLAWMCELRQSTVHRMIKQLVARRLLIIERRFNKNGSCTSNGYRLAITDHPIQLTGWGSPVKGGPRHW